MKGGFYIKPFTEACNFHGRSYTSNLRNMYADIIKPLIDHRHFKLIDVIEQFAHSNRNSCAHPKLLKPFHVFRRKWVFNKIRMIVFYSLDHINHIHWLYAFMHVMQQFNIIATNFSYRLKHLWYGF